MRVLGIDLGTTNTVAAIENYPVRLSGKAGTVMPSVVSFLPNGSQQVGAGASRRRPLDPGNTVFSSKRIIGRRWSSSEARLFRERYPCELAELEDDGVAFATRAGHFTPTAIASILLAEVLDQVKDSAWSLEARTIAVPTAFQAPQRHATLEAARQAGLGELQLVDEPMAVVHAYLNHPRFDAGLAAVYDLGGGTFNFALADCTGSSPQLLAHGSDLFLGGDDVDQLLGKWVSERVIERYNWDLRNYSEVHARLVTECEQAKIRLSSVEETVVDLTQVDPDCPGAVDGVELRADVLEGLCDPIRRRTFATCDEVLAKAGLRPGQVDAILLAGGSTKMPGVRRGVVSYFDKPGLCRVDPTEVVALGASLIHG